MPIMIKTVDAASFLRALSIAASQAQDVAEVPERNLFCVDHLSDDAKRRLEKLGARVEPVLWPVAGRTTPPAIAVGA